MKFREISDIAVILSISGDKRKTENNVYGIVFSCVEKGGMPLLRQGRVSASSGEVYVSGFLVHERW